MPSVPGSHATAESSLPDIDDRLVEPETPYEMLDGVVRYVSPADAPHAERQAQLLQLIGAHVALEFTVACELLTRSSAVDDFAPDVSVYPTARHPQTGRRQLEQLVFEVVSTQSLGDAGTKAAKLAARGVRRVFAIDIKRARALEWSTEQGGWRRIDALYIEDPALDVPLPLDALIRATQPNDSIARALLVKNNPVIEAARALDRVEGRAEGQREMLLVVLAARSIAVDSAAIVRIRAESDPARLERWIVRASTCRIVAELFIEP